VGAPLAEYRVGSLKHADVDVIIRWRKRSHQLLELGSDGTKDVCARLTSMRSGHLSGKSSSAMRETASATCALIALSAGLERASMAGTSSDRRAALSCSGMG
jgi:hypothetical protein